MSADMNVVLRDARHIAAKLRAEAEGHRRAHPGGSLPDACFQAIAAIERLANLLAEQARTPRPEQVDALALIAEARNRASVLHIKNGAQRDALLVERLAAALEVAEMWIGAAQTGEPMYPAAPPPGAEPVSQEMFDALVRDAMKWRARGLAVAAPSPAVLAKIQRVGSDESGRWCTGCGAYTTSFGDDLKHDADCAWRAIDSAPLSPPPEGPSATAKPRIPFGSEKRADFRANSCHDCCVKMGELHDAGCDVEECETCGRQRISCDCCKVCRSNADTWTVCAECIELAERARASAPPPEETSP